MDILTLADGFICHTEESYDYAKNISDNVYKYRFPLMKITDNPEQVLSSQFDQHHERNEIKFLFIGGLRPEKGVQLLIDSFTGILNANIEQKISLTIAGKSIPGMTFHSTSSDIKIIDKYISDHEFLFLISEADYVVLPYLEGTNSGILSTVSSTLTPVIASNLPMFVESSFIAKNNLFEKASLDSLSELLLSKINNYSESKQVDDLFIYQSVANYEESFKVELNECYAEILK
jgi:glycosyltransferase involved in cell wall biosynthesis